MKLVVVVAWEHYLIQNLFGLAQVSNILTYLFLVIRPDNCLTGQTKITKKNKMKRHHALSWSTFAFLLITVSLIRFTPTTRATCYYEFASPTTSIPISATQKSLENDILPQVPSSATLIYCYSESLTGTIPSMNAYTALTYLYVKNQHFFLVLSTETVSFFIRRLVTTALSGSIPDMSANTALAYLYVKSAFLFSS